MELARLSRLGAFALVAGLGVVAAPAGAAEQTPVPTLAVLDIKPVGNVDPSSVTALSALISSEAAKARAKVISGADIRNLLGLEQQKQLLGCSEGTCLAELGGALGADHLLASEVGEVGGRWLLTITLLDTRHSTALRRVTKLGSSPGALVDLVGPAVAEALQDLHPAAITSAAPVSVEPSVAASTRSPAVDPLALQRPVEGASAFGRKQVGYSLVALAGASVLGGLVSGVLARNQHEDAISDRPTSDAELSSTKSSIERKLWIADGLFLVSAVSAGVGAWLLFGGSSPSSSGPLGIAPIPGGAVVVVGGGF